MEELSAEELMILFQKTEDPTYLAVIFDRFRRDIRDWVRKRRGQKSPWLDDAFQLAYLKVSKDPKDYQRRAPVVAYLAKVVERQLLDLHRKYVKGRAKAHMLLIEDDFDAVDSGAIESLLCPAPSSPEAAAIAKEGVEYLQILLSECEADDREVFIRRYEHGMSYKQIAALLSIPEGTVGTRLKRARDYVDSRWHRRVA